jgi:hypothetical protein
MFEIKACDREKNEAVVEQPSWNSRRGTAAIEWVPFRNRSAEAEYFFDKRNEEVGHYGLTLFGCFLLCSAQEISYVVKENISYYSQEINALDQYTKERWVHDINYPEGIADTRFEQKMA